MTPAFKRVKPWVQRYPAIPFLLFSGVRLLDAVMSGPSMLWCSCAVRSLCWGQARCSEAESFLQPWPPRGRVGWGVLFGKLTSSRARRQDIFSGSGFLYPQIWNGRQGPDCPGVRGAGWWGCVFQRLLGSRLLLRKWLGTEFKLWTALDLCRPFMPAFSPESWWGAHWASFPPFPAGWVSTRPRASTTAWCRTSRCTWASGRCITPFPVCCQRSGFSLHPGRRVLAERFTF